MVNSSNYKNKTKKLFYYKKVLVKTTLKNLNNPHKSECSTSNTMEEGDPSKDSHEMQSQTKETLVSESTQIKLLK